MDFNFFNAAKLSGFDNSAMISPARSLVSAKTGVVLCPDNIKICSIFNPFHFHRDNIRNGVAAIPSKTGVLSSENKKADLLQKSAFLLQKCLFSVAKF